MPLLRTRTELDLEIALAALTNIKRYCGIICEECGDSDFMHVECASSQEAWTIAVNALHRIKQYQQGEYNEHQLAKYKSKE
jgi:hypothetical protein